MIAAHEKSAEQLERSAERRLTVTHFQSDKLHRMNGGRSRGGGEVVSSCSPICTTLDDARKENEGRRDGLPFIILGDRWWREGIHYLVLP